MVGMVTVVIGVKAGGGECGDCGECILCFILVSPCPRYCQSIKWVRSTVKFQ
jgi:hypothetical protein